MAVSPAAAMLVQRANIPVSLLAPADAELILCPSMLRITSMRCLSRDWVVFWHQGRRAVFSCLGFSCQASVTKEHEISVKLPAFTLDLNW